MTRDYSRPWPERIRESAERSRKYSRARGRAIARLTQKHKDEFQRLYAEEKEKHLGGAS